MPYTIKSAISAALFIGLTPFVMIGCGGGEILQIESDVAPIIKAAAPKPVKKATSVTGANKIAIHTYQALYGQAPSNAMLIGFVNQIGTSDGFAWAASMIDSFKAMSDSDFSTLVLKNLGITPTSLTTSTIDTSVTGAIAYAAIQGALRDYFAWTGVQSRGTVVIQLSEIVSNLESADVYGAAAIAFNGQTTRNFRYSVNNGVELLASTPILLPDLRPTYLAICGPGRENGMVLHKPIILDLNKDGRKDILLTMWCDQPVVGVVDTGPVPSRILAFLQQADGTFINGTKDIFGSETASMSGASIHAVAYDFNGDGYDDVVIANNKEDGRLLPDNINNVQNTYILSSESGRYTVGQFGTYQWGYDMFLMDNNFGKRDIVATPIGYGTGSDAWRYDGRWTRLPSDYGWAKPNAVIFKRRAADQGSQIAITDIGIANTLGFALYTRTNTTEWSRVSDLIIGTYLQVPYGVWNTETGFAALITNDGQDYVAAYIEQGCELKIRPNDESVAVMQFGAFKLPTKVWDGKPLVQGQNMTWQSQIIGFSVANGALTRLNIPIKNEITQFTSLHMTCGDVNGDGYDDIVVEQRATGGTNVSPFIYINDRNGGFALVDTIIFPSSSPLNNDTSNMFVDIDGDGISDLMYWAVDGVQNNSTGPIQIQLFRGLRNITASDLK